MKNVNIMGPDVSLNLDYTKLPIGSTQIGPDSNQMKTGAWRFFRPELVSSIAPCTADCPAGVDIRNFIRLLGEGSEEASLISYLEENPFPAILGRVCFHPCESACNRNCYDETVSVNALENYIGRLTTENISCMEENKKKVAVIGSGPSGLSCAYFLRRLGYSVNIFESEPKSGGVLRYGIPEYRLPKKILDKEIKKLKSLGITIQNDKELGNNLSLEDLESYDAVFVAIGAHSPAKPDIPGIKSQEVYYGLDFLKKVAKLEISAFKKRTVVIGGGNTAIDVARTVLRLGGRPSIYYRRSRDEMPAIAAEIIDCEKEGIEVHQLTTPVKITAAANEVTGVEFIKNTLGNPDKGGRPVPVPLDGSSYTVNADAVILATGEQADLSLLGNQVTTADRLITVNHIGQSSAPRIFSGGDVVNNNRTVVEAVNDGKRAAIGIDCYLGGLNEEKSLELMNAIATNDKGAVSFARYKNKDFNAVPQKIVRYEDLNTFYFQHMKRNERREIPVETRSGNFAEVRSSLSREAAKKEAIRCFSCGACNLCSNCYILCPDASIIFDENATSIEINYDYCKGCGICMQECPRSSIRMVQEE